jgi:hypothetical protein
MPVSEIMGVIMSRQLKEVLCVWAAIFTYCAVMSVAQNRDQIAEDEALAAEMEKLKEPLVRTCIYKHGVDEIHYLNCKVVSEKYAVLN